jgi:hypothetical protein
MHNAGVGAGGVLGQEEGRHSRHARLGHYHCFAREAAGAEVHSSYTGDTEDRLQGSYTDMDMGKGRDTWGLGEEGLGSVQLVLLLHPLLVRREVCMYGGVDGRGRGRKGQG